MFEFRLETWEASCDFCYTLYTYICFFYTPIFLHSSLVVTVFSTFFNVKKHWVLSKECNHGLRMLLRTGRDVFFNSINRSVFVVEAYSVSWELNFLVQRLNNHLIWSYIGIFFATDIGLMEITDYKVGIMQETITGSSLVKFRSQYRDRSQFYWI